MNRYKKIILHTFLISSTTAFSKQAPAFPIYFEAPRSAIGGRIFDSPQSACDALNEVINYDAGDIQVLTPPSPPTITNWFCNIKDASGKGAVGVWLYEKGYDCPGDTSYNPLLHQCIYGAQNGRPVSYACPTPTAGNPINLLSKNKIQIEHDLSATDSSGIEFFRTYNSADGLWRHNFSSHMEFFTDHIALIFEDGRNTFFQPKEEYKATSNYEFGNLVKIDSGWKFSAPDGSFMEFNSSGKITRLRKSVDSDFTLARNGLSTTVTNLQGNSLTFTEDAIGQPLAMSSGNLTVTYQYDTAQRLVSLTANRLTASTSRKYLYEHTSRPRLLTGVVDENGIKYAQWSYDASGNPISSEHAGGTLKTIVSYPTYDSISVTNEYGRKSIYQIQGSVGNKRITSIKGEPTANCPYSNSSFTYDTRGLLKTKVDEKGNVTAYDYNNRGLETSRTEASGTPQARTITTEWHPTLFLKTKVTEPDRITTYQYDAQGRQTGQIVTPR